MTNCFLCKEQVSSFSLRAYSRDDLKDDERIIPKGMLDEDRVCSRCFDTHRAIKKKSPYEKYSEDMDESQEVINEKTTGSNFCGKCGSVIQSPNSFCTNCGEKKSDLELTQSPYYKKQTSSAIWILPILLGIIGGLIMYFVIVNDDKSKAQNGLILGVILTVIDIIIAFTLFPAGMFF